ncbi:MAG: O-antigen translocase [Altibacter sp.]|nr:O-antigen translocase [Altibacter sp.]
MLDPKTSYRQVLKATSLFGGVQVFSIVIAIIRSKAIALLIGPTGMGIASLLNSTIHLVNGLTNAGLGQSAVKDISFVDGGNDLQKTFRTIRILRRLVWFTGLIGALLMILTAPFLSEFAFGDGAYTYAFVWLSLALLFNQLTTAELAVLQGLRKLQRLAKANLIGNFLGLVITLPLYYYFRLDAIVPAIIIAALISLLFTVYFSRKEGNTTGKLTSKEALLEGKEMIRLGVMLSLSNMITLGVAYLVQVFINSEGGIDEVGLYNAGYVILNSYVGLIFTAMATDYYPRLAAITDKIDAVRKTVFEQAFIAILIITPIIVVFLTLAPYIIVLLYSTEFTPIVAFVSWGILGMIFKAVSFSMGYVIIAKGDSKLFIKTSVAFNTLLLLGNILGYYYGGLEGLGISFFLYYIFHFVLVRVIIKYRYDFYFDKGFYPIFIVCIALCVAAFCLTFIEYPLLKYALMSLVVILSTVFSYVQLDKKLDIKELFSKILKRKK